MNSCMQKIKQVYTDCKNADWYCVSVNGNTSVTVHKKSEPDLPKHTCNFNTGMTVHLADLIIITAAALAVSAVAGAVCSCCHCK